MPDTGLENVKSSHEHTLKSCYTKPVPEERSGAEDQKTTYESTPKSQTTKANFIRL